MYKRQGKRLLRCDVQGRAGDQGGGQGGVQVFLVDDTTTGGVDQIGAPLHFLEGGQVEQIAGAGLERAVNADHVGLLEQGDVYKRQGQRSAKAPHIKGS